MKKFIVLVLLIVYVGALPIIGQVVTEEEVVELLNGHILQLDNQTNKNLSFIRQVGSKNSAISIQEQGGIISNLVMMNQDGIANAGYIEHSGSELTTHLWQYNIGNEANLWLIGKNISTSVKQNGEKNVVNSFIENDGVNKRLATFLQEGNQNKIDFSLIGSHPIEQVAIINQYGNQHQVDAHMEPLSVPLIINQQGAEGMKVNVSTSAFNFPMKKH